MNDSFLKQIIKTHNFSLGQPRNITICQDAGKVFFLRSKTGTDPDNCLWKIDITKGFKEELVIDPAIIGASVGNVSDAERSRRERARESAGGIVSFSVDSQGNIAAFVLGGDVYTVRDGQEPVCASNAKGAYDPELSPDGERLAYVLNGSLCVETTGKPGRYDVIAKSKDPNLVTWGQADFIAAEEMDRLSGYWWAPDSTYILASQVDNRPIKDCYIADLSHPEIEPTKTKYPFAGTANAKVKLAIINVRNGKYTQVEWDNRKYPYLVDVDWSRIGLCVMVQSRDQKSIKTLKVDTKTGETSSIHEVKDDQWVELVPGFPIQLTDGRILGIINQENRCLSIGDKAYQMNLNVKSLGGLLSDGTIVFTAWQDDPKSPQVWAWNLRDKPHKLTSQPGHHGAAARGSICVVRSSNLENIGSAVTIYHIKNQKWQKAGVLKSCNDRPLVKPRPMFRRSKKRLLETALLLPTNYDGKSKLPVLVDPYGGPHAQRVISVQAAYLESQWFANQGFAVVIADGRGTPGRGPAWEKAVYGDLIGPVLEDQVEALQDLASQDNRLDLKHVGIRGWSFGGYLAAFAVIRYPKIFHAAIAGAPVTDWRLYDTHYSERYLGDPKSNAAAYDGCSLLKAADKLTRPLLLIHGLADDNVLFANSLQLSSALLKASKPHQLLPLVNMTHMASRGDVAESMAELELQFFQNHLL